MSNKYNTAQAVILIVAFISYIIAHFIGVVDSSVSFIMGLIILNAGLQSLASWHFNNHYAKAQDLATCLKNAHEAEILKMKRATEKVLLVLACFYLFLLESSIILNIFNI